MASYKILLALFSCSKQLIIPLTVNPTPMKINIIPMVMYAQQRLRGSAHPTEELKSNIIAGQTLNTKTGLTWNSEIFI